MQMPDPQSPLKIGTRGSPLALAQAEEAQARLAVAWDLPFEAFEIVIIRTTGDRVVDRPLSQLGGKGMFTKEIEEALLSGGIDIAVHSTKDMPTRQPEGLALDCFLEREDPRDAFVSLVHGGIRDLPEGATVGTSSLRRRAQLLARRPDLRVVEFRGNLQTRLLKLSDGVADATFLAAAGLSRLKMTEVPARAIAPEDMLPAVAQGAICIERRAEDARTGALLEPLRHGPTHLSIAAERAYLEALDGSCQTPIAGLAELSGGQLRLRGEILRTDGSEVLTGDETGAAEDGAEIGRAMAERLLAQAGPGFFD
ncbi:hydroxymethylbilane synthase [Pseudoroseicyclus aestuarii]|uniref:Porphobilinogen deaminase n=1 Tax=Pseudoroseicyclus aestuarii TaxID=1795041 RepID=A0A318SZA3_9RHOB|nr:hydroxymethylbilane synthase [Pseudoroseicyclus aestuarii]PYE85097.1 hydroxymethylbilane synthase [Pseudoroseicyclus aestuarii]